MFAEGAPRGGHGRGPTRRPEGSIVQGQSTAKTRRAEKARKGMAGIHERHSRACAKNEGKRCSCRPTYRVVVSLGSRGEILRKTFDTPEEAKRWRAKQLGAKAEGRVVAPSRVRLDAAAAEFLDGIKTGRIKTRSGQPYKPSTIRSYEQSLNLYVLDDFGARPVGGITPGDVQGLVERMSGAGQSGSTIANAINPLRAIFRRLRLLGHVSMNPTLGVVIPTSRAKRLHAGDPADAARVIAAMDAQDQCVWALAFFAGLRLGELRALRWGDVDEPARVIHVRLSFDVKEGEIEPKSGAGVRDVPILARLEPYLTAQRAACAWADDPQGRVLGATRRSPFGYTGLRGRSKRALIAAKLPYVTLHEARHSFASFLAAAGIGIKDLTVILGHSSVVVSLDRYGHLFEGALATTAAQLNAWLDASDTKNRVTQLST
jgi:integrase